MAGCHPDLICQGLFRSAAAVVSQLDIPKDGPLPFRSQLSSSNNHSWHPRNQFQAPQNLALDGPLSSTPLAWKVVQGNNTSSLLKHQEPHDVRRTRTAIHPPEPDFKPTKISLGWILPSRPCFRRFCRPAAAILVLCSKQQQQPQMTPENTISGTQNDLLDGP